MTFLDNTGLLVELEGSTDVRRRGGISLVEEFIVGMVLECKTHELQDMVDKFVGWIHPDETTSRGIRTEALLTGGSKHDSNIVVALMLRYQELETFLPGSIALVVTFNKTTDTILNLTYYREIPFHCITHHVSNFVDNEGMHGFVILVHRKHAGFN